MTAEEGPDRAVPLDPAARRRRNWGTSAGVLLVVAAVVVGLVVAGNGGSSKSGSTPVTTEAGVAAAPSSSAAAPSSAGPAPTTAPTPSASAPASPPASVPASASAPASSPVPAFDVDGDGRPDTARTQFVSARKAEVVVQLATGETLTSKAFPLYKQGGAGKVIGADVNGDHHSELLVSDPGADGIGYHLFAYVDSSLVAVPVPKGNGLYIGGGMYYQSSFGCAEDRLFQLSEAPDVKSTADLPPDPPFLVTTTTYALTGGHLAATDTTTVGVADRAQAAAKLAKAGNDCGTRP